MPTAAGAHVGFVAGSESQGNAAYLAAISAGATDNPAAGGAFAPRLHYVPRHFAANVFDPDGHSFEFVYKSWQHPTG